MINLSIPDTAQQLQPRITVVGVGGAGGNAVNNMIRSNLEGVHFLVCNTDAQALASSSAEHSLQMGKGVTQGLGAGSRPDIGRAAAEEAIDQIISYLEGSHMVFITAGMGGGTGTGAAPVIARAAREQGILTVGVVTKPFNFEGSHRMRTADQGLQDLQHYVDTLIVIPNQNLFRIANEKTTFADAFKMADDVLYAGVRGVTDLMMMPGLINLDFADIRSVMSEMGKAMMGTGEGTGDRRAIQAAEAAISNPLLDEVSMKGARGVLINITGGNDITLYEVDEAANQIREQVDPEANIIFGSTFDPNMDGNLRVSVVATGIDAEVREAGRPLVTSLSAVNEKRRAATMLDLAPEPAPRLEPAPAVAEFETETAAEAATAGAGPEDRPAAAAGPGTAAAGLRPDAGSAGSQDGAMVEEEFEEPEKLVAAGGGGAPRVSSNLWRQPQAQPGAGNTGRATGAPAAGRQPGFGGPRGLSPSADRPQAATPRPVGQGGAAPATRPEEPASGQKRHLGLFRRMTRLLGDDESSSGGSGDRRRDAQDSQNGQNHAAPPQSTSGRSQPQRSQAPRLSAVESGNRAPLPKHEDEALDIPAFLRRQAN
ncbi:MAG: cell division protein FtsZ [Alphaproteobacteria bacterium]|jgi:cell division protein FtsZ|nr:cell division protein FtsZ [Alphaproteobacteria bacterium]